ncbi:MAG: hypothetical protein ACFFEV_06730, partial [Candidatus Thorarchaeota archaeon]
MQRQLGKRLYTISLVLLMLLPVIAIQPSIIAIPTNSGGLQRGDGIPSSSTAYEGQYETTFVEDYSDIQKAYSYIPESSANLIIVYDSTDNVTTAAANLFAGILENQARPLLVPVTHFMELSAVLENVRVDQVVIEVVHGVTDSLMINKGYTEWSELQQIIEESNADRHVLASCFSAVLDTDANDLRIKGLETLLDYEIAVPMLSLYALEFLYEKDGIDRTETGLVLQRFFEAEKDLVLRRLLTPRNILGEKMTLRQQSAFMNNIRDLIDVAIDFLKTNMKDLARGILNAIFSLIPESIYDASDILDSALSTMEAIDLSALDGLPAKVEDSLDGKGKEFEKEVKKGIKVGVLVKFHVDKNLDGKTRYQIKSTYLQLGWKLSIEHWKPFQLGPIPLNITFEFNAFQMFDILLEYLGHDPNWVSTEGHEINPAMFKVNETAGDNPNNASQAISLLAYANIEGPYGDVPIEAWWGAPLVDIPLCTRSYGGLSFSITVKLALAHEAVLKKIGHTDDAIAKAVKKICDMLSSDVKFGKGGIHGYFTLTGDGMKITILYANWIGIEMDLEFKFGKNIKIKFHGHIKLENLIMGEITWDLDGLYLSMVKVFWPRITFGLKIGIEIKIPVPFVPPIKLDLDLAKILGLTTHYFPFGPHTDHATESFGNVLISGSWQTYNDAPIFAKVPIPVNGFVMKIVGALAVLITGMTGDAIEDLLNGKIEVVNGTVVDQTPPVIFFTTPSYIGDPLTQWDDMADGFDPNLDQASLVNVPSSTSILDISSADQLEKVNFDVNSTVSGDDMTDGAAVIEVNKSRFIPLWGDNASIRLYTFDKHDGDNNASYVKRVTVTASFQAKKTVVNYGIGEYLYSLDASYTFSPTGQSTMMRLFYTLDIYERLVLFYDDQGNLFDWSRTTFRTDEPVRTSGFTKWVNTTYIFVIIKVMSHTGDDNLDDTEDHETPTIVPYSRLNILGGEIQYSTCWDSNVSARVPATELENGGIFLDADSVEWNGLGDGPIYETRGYEAYWDLKIPLHKFYEEGLIDPGMVTFTATAYDTADLSTTTSYSYYVDVPPDTAAPIVNRVSANTRDVTEQQEPSPYIAASGIQNYDFDVVEQLQYITYNFDFGPGTSTRGYHTGIPYQWPNQTVIHRVNPRAILTHGSWIENAFRYEMNTPISNTDTTYLTTDVMFEGDYSIHIYADTNTAVNEFVYSNIWNLEEPCLAGEEVHVPTDYLDLN